MKYLYCCFIILSVFILNTLISLKNNINLVLSPQTNNYELNLTLKSNLKETEVDSLIEKIKKDLSLDKQSQVKYLNSESQLKEMNTFLPHFDVNLFGTAELQNILNPMLTIEISSEKNIDSIRSLLEQYSEIIQIQSSHDWVKKIQSTLKVLNKIFISLIFVFFLSLTFLNTLFIKSSLIESNDIIELKSLLGATPIQGFIEDYYRLALLTLASYLSGILLSVLVLTYFFKQLNQLPQFFQITKQLSYLGSENIIIFLGGLLMSLGFSFLFSYQHINSHFYQND